MLIALVDIKRHLRLDPDPQYDVDQELTALLDAAVDHVSQFLGRPVPWEDHTVTSSEVMVFPPSVRAAILLVIGDLYENREGQTAGVSYDQNPTLKSILHFYRIGLGI